MDNESLGLPVEERIVAFLDVLGFKDLVDRMFASERELFPALNEALDGVNRWAELGQSPGPLGCPVVTTVFSDSIVVSATGESSFNDVVMHISFIAHALFEREILCRGGVARGPLYHVDGRVFGPAMISAFRLQDEVAIYPRIVIADNLLHDLANLCAYPIPMVQRDFDGTWFVNLFWLSWRSAKSVGSGISGILRSILKGQADEASFAKARAIIVRKLDDETSPGKCRPRVLAKYRWLANHFNATVLAHLRGSIEPIEI